MIIAFMGNDGTGKTTVIKLLKQKLLNSRIEVDYVPGYEHLFVNSIKKYYQKLTGKNIKKLQNEYDNASRSKTSKLFYIWPYIILIDYVAIIFKYWFKPKRVILFDRYAYDYVISFKYLGVCSKLVEFFLLSLPRPVYCFIFDASPEIAYERKKEDHKGDIGYYREQQERYLWLARKKNIEVINTDKTKPNVIVEQIFKQILKNKNS